MTWALLASIFHMLVLIYNGFFPFSWLLFLWPTLVTPAPSIFPQKSCYPNTVLTRFRWLACHLSGTSTYWFHPIWDLSIHSFEAVIIFPVGMHLWARKCTKSVIYFFPTHELKWKKSLGLPLRHSAPHQDIPFVNLGFLVELNILIIEEG